jgi:hypothetical protein
MATSHRCTIQGDLFNSQRLEVTVEATTLDEFIASIMRKLDVQFPLEALLLEVYDDDFDEFVGKIL